MVNYDKYYEYVTLQGDTWDAIALDFYNDEYKASFLMEVNPEYITVLEFDEGTKLIIPVIEESAKTTLPPWKQG